jgi:hypothetical protein
MNSEDLMRLGPAAICKAFRQGGSYGCCEVVRIQEGE